MNISYSVDPTNNFLRTPNEDLLEACGFIPHWVVSPEFQELPLQEALEIQYGFGSLIEMTGSKINENGVMSYPGDPDLYPLIRINRGDEIFYQYQYGIVAFINKDKDVFITRMD